MRRGSDVCDGGGDGGNKSICLQTIKPGGKWKNTIEYICNIRLL